jgi:hypothetical protein
MESTKNMNASFNGLSGRWGAAVALLRALGRKLRIGMGKFIPMGYEDEDGFHVDGGK